MFNRRVDSPTPDFDAMTQNEIEIVIEVVLWEGNPRRGEHTVYKGRTSLRVPDLTIYRVVMASSLVDWRSTISR